MDQRPPGRPEEAPPPKVSIIILVLEDVSRLLSCLASVRGTSGGVDYETIVVANGTSPVELEQLAELQVTLITLPYNVGFAAGCNIGASTARGELLVFLNDDTSAMAGWLHNLVAAQMSTQDVGAVCSKLINRDGTLQEAGGVVWRSGRADRVSGAAPFYLVDSARDVDYASACGLLVSQDTYWRVGGFDESYFPAYFEDLDLCFSLRSAGYRVVYEPLASLIHEGSASTRPGLRDFAAEKNQEHFVAKWRPELERRELEPAEALLGESIVQAAGHPPTPLGKPLEAGHAAKPAELSQWELFLRSVAALERYGALQKSYIDRLEFERENLRVEQAKLDYLRSLFGRVPLAERMRGWLGRRVGARNGDSTGREDPGDR